MSNQQDLERAIATLESQRSLLGHDVVDASIAALRHQATTRLPTQRKQVTVLFGDLSGFTRLTETLDPEDISDAINNLWARLDRIITAHGGYIDKHIGDAVMALFGAQDMREDAPEQAVRAALEIQRQLRETPFSPVIAVPLSMRIGIHTGEVLLGQVGTRGEYTATGSTVNIAARLEPVAAPGTVLISHDTYRHVRGLFVVTGQKPLDIRGHSQPLRVYQIEGAKPRAFRLPTRGVEGIETPMIGRDRELRLLQAAYQTVLDEQEMQVITVLGEPGVGKSRLLYEFDTWIDLRPEEALYLRGRATPESSRSPYGLLRNLFATQFNILESDSAEDVRAKLVAGIAPVLKEPEAAALIGQLLGYDFSQEPAVATLLNNARQLYEQAVGQVIQYFRQAARQYRPTVLFVEDIHWADAASKEVLERLARAYQQMPLLMVCLARPVFTEQNPQWGEGWLHHTRLELRPLSTHDSDQLLQAILSKASEVPADLRDLIVQRADGNPFYLEELVKMLIEDGVISMGEEQWTIDMARLSQIRVPATLAEVLQVRLATLLPAEQAILQRAAVVGRIFWDSAVEYLLTAGEKGGRTADVSPTLDKLRGRELVFVRGSSAFAGAREYIFKHALLHEVTYQSVLLKQRRQYHQWVAQWLERTSGDRINEYLGLIASHHEQAGSIDDAVNYLTRAAEQAIYITAYMEAEAFLKQAEKLIQQHPQAVQPRTEAYFEHFYGLYLYGRGDYPAAQQALEKSIALARQAGDLERFALVSYNLGWQVGYILKDTASGRRILEEALTVAEQINHPVATARLLNGLGALAADEQDFERSRAYYHRSIAIAEEINFLPIVAAAGNNLGELEKQLGNFAEAKRYFERQYSLASGVKNIDGMVIGLDNLGQAEMGLKNYAQARAYFEEGVAISQRNGNRLILSDILFSFSLLALHEEKNDEALKLVTQAWTARSELGAVSGALMSMVTLAQWLAEHGKVREALALLHALLAHPARTGALEAKANALLTDLEAELPAPLVAEIKVASQPFTLELLKDYF